MIIEIETRFKLDEHTNIDELDKALEAELFEELYGTDFYWDWEESKKNGIWQRIRDLHVKENSLYVSYGISQTKTRIQSPPNPYGIECWEESYPNPVKAATELENLKRQGYSFLVVKLARRSYYVEFDGKKLEINLDNASYPSGRYIEIGVNVNNQHDIPQYIDLISGFINQSVLGVFEGIGVNTQAMPIYPVVLLNGR